VNSADYRSAEEIRFGNDFRGSGYVIGEVEDRSALDRLRWLIVDAASAFLGLSRPADPEAWLDSVGDHVSSEALNAMRLAVIARLNAASWSRRAYFDCARRALESVVGNELCMQRRINLSIQLPGDDASLLPLHSDTWSGDSPFEVVLWIPFTRCYGTKSMYVLSPGATPGFQACLHAYESAGVENAFRSIEDQVMWIEISYGQYLLFNQNLPHGNRVNREATARWSANCRFKGVFTPYADKKLGEFFEPITLRPASRIGLEYQLPGGFNE
jgi:sporadic carbohydrate cluster 2OG-Fe(II) oxygenase